MLDKKQYLGRWYDNNVDPNDAIKTVIDVDQSKREAIFNTGERCSLQDLELSGRFDRIGDLVDDPSIAGEIAAQAPKSKMLDGLDKMSSRHNNAAKNRPLSENANVKSVEKDKKSINTGFASKSTFIPDDPVGQFIESAILISKKANKKSVIPLTFNLELDFDILSIIQTAMGIGASDIEILQHVMKHINIKPEYIKQLIAEALCECPEDAEIVNENREDEFNKTLTEELNKEENSVKINEDDKPQYVDL